MEKVIPETLNLKDLNIGKKYVFIDDGYHEGDNLVKVKLLCHSLTMQNEDGCISGKFILLEDIDSKPKILTELFENDYYTVSYRAGFQDYFNWAFLEVTDKSDVLSEGKE